MNPLKRKSPGWSTPSNAGPSTFVVKQEPQVKNEPGTSDGFKRQKSGSNLAFSSLPGSSSTASNRISNGNKNASYQDPRAAALELRDFLKARGTMSSIDAQFHIDEQFPGMDHLQILEYLKGMERVRFNDINNVFEYIPELTITSQNQLLSHIRVHTTPTKSIQVRPLREAIPAPHNSSEWLYELEKSGDILIVRTLGPFKEAELPPLGRKNGLGYGILDAEKLPGSRYRSVFWDEVRSRGRAGKKVDDEFVHLWGDIQIAETDDVTKLLVQHDLSASSNIPEPPKAVIQDNKKKKRKARPLKITNTHMKQYGIDFSKEYEKGS